MSEQSEKHILDYDRMLERTKAFLAESKAELTPKLEEALDFAKEKATELGELTLEEAERIGDYLKRDLQDAVDYLAENGGDLKSWLRFDVELVEERILDALSLLVDPTQVDLAEFAAQAKAAEWHTGEVTGPGTLECSDCGETLHFHKTGHIPPCPKCAGTRFQRESDQ